MLEYLGVLVLAAYMALIWPGALQSYRVVEEARETDGGRHGRIGGYSLADDSSRP